MTQRLDARAAAAAIRERIRQPSPEDRHIEAFAKDVASQLGLDHSAPNLMAVVHALRDADIQAHRAQEYPKHVQDYAGNTVTVNDENEERRAREEPPPDEPPPPAEAVDQYPKTVMRRGTDGHDHPVQVRDLKEERELLGLDDQPIDPATPRQSDQKDLPAVSDEELAEHDAADGGRLQREALEQVNRPKAPVVPRRAPPPGPTVAGRPPAKSSE